MEGQERLTNREATLLFARKDEGFSTDSQSACRKCTPGSVAHEMKSRQNYSPSWIRPSLTSWIATKFRDRFDSKREKCPPRGVIRRAQIALILFQGIITNPLLDEETVDLARLITWRSKDGGRLGPLALIGQCRAETEVCHLRAEVLVQQDVAALHVPESSRLLV